MRVVVGVGGGIAAYKVCSLVRLLTEGGAAVRVVPTRAALRFVGEATWAALSGEPVTTEVWQDVDDVAHVRIGREASLVVVAPATADLLARAACGLADDLLTATLLTATCPVLMAPAMHTEMWQHPATRANVEVLRSRGVHVLEPAVGRLTGPDSGPGRLPEPDEIYQAALALLAGPPVASPRAAPPRADSPRAAPPRADLGVFVDRQAAGSTTSPRSARGEPLAGRRVVVSAGGTREPLDPVRFLGNRSSGKQGLALATVARDLGAQVTLVAANIALPVPEGVEVVEVGTALELRDAVLEAATDADAVVMAAAVADFRPARFAADKIKKREGEDPSPIELVRNPDVLTELAASRRAGQVVVGFAAETSDILANGRDKLARKGCDLLVVNEVGAGKAFGTPDNAAVILGRDGSEVPVPLGPKEALAAAVWRRVGELLVAG